MTDNIFSSLSDQELRREYVDELIRRASPSFRQFSVSGTLTEEYVAWYADLCAEVERRQLIRKSQ
jgi:hypothetical protein